MSKGYQMTLCWKCRNSVGKCSWSDGSFTPVEGWTASPTRLLHWVDDYPHWDDSYLVLRCPKFQPDEEEKKDAKK